MGALSQVCPSSEPIEAAAHEARIAVLVVVKDVVSSTIPMVRVAIVVVFVTSVCYRWGTRLARSS